jgi:Holliday junction resolvasome RuvABC endonuclease subunit
MTSAPPAPVPDLTDLAVLGAGGAETIVIGLDASPLRVGYAIMIVQTGRLLASGTMHVESGGDDLRNRQAAWRHIISELNRVTDSSRVVCVGLEEAYVRFRRQAILGALTIGNLEAFALRSYPWILVHRLLPTEWRRICGIQQGGKAAPLAYAQMVVPGLTDQDEADAICIARALCALID